MKHIVMFSGGIGSWGAARRVREKYGIDDMILLFTDTKVEDPDLYRFIIEASDYLGIKLTTIEDGRDIWQVFKDERYLNRIFPNCSKILKKQTSFKWIKNKYKPTEVIIYLGFDWSEIHRHERVQEKNKPWKYESPLIEKPFVDKKDLLKDLLNVGIKPPRLYSLGFKHNNCGGFCIKAGLSHFKLLYNTLPEKYQEVETKELQFYKFIGKVTPFLSKTENKKKKYLTLKEFRENYLEKDKQISLFDWGGCGCFSD